MDFCLTTPDSFIASQPTACQSRRRHVTPTHPPGGGRPGLLRAAAAGPAAQTQSRHRDQQKTPPQRPEPSMQRARCPAVLVLAALALCSLGVSSQADRDGDQNQDLDLDLELRRHRLLQRARSAGFLAQEWGKRAVEDLLAQMSRPEVEAQQADVVSMATEGRVNLERSVDPPNNVQQRDRKAGCKNFYWKGFTSC